MPSDESLGLDHGQRLSPGEPSGKQDESQLRGSLRPARLNLVVQIQSQLLTKEEVFSGQSASGLKTELDKPQGVQQKIDGGHDYVGQRIQFRHQPQNRTSTDTGHNLDGINRGVRDYCGRQWIRKSNLYRMFLSRA